MPQGVQWFFKEEIKSHGWYTANLRRLAIRFRLSIGKQTGVEFWTQLARRLFTGRVLEERIVAVLFLEKSTAGLDEQHFGSVRILDRAHKQLGRP